MATLVDIDAALARRLRMEREARGWSQSQVAERSGVSKAMISKIERAETSPTASLIARIAAAFGLTLAGFLLELERQGSRITRAEDQPVWTDPGTGYVRRQLLALSDHPIELAEITLPGRERVAFPASTYAFIRQVVWVLQGRLTIIEAGERCELAEGDCLAFGPPADAIFANETPEPCRYLVALNRQ